MVFYDIFIVLEGVSVIVGYVGEMMLLLFLEGSFEGVIYVRLEIWFDW